MELDQFLEHYGVRGMRWGVRRSRSNRPQSHESRKVSELKKRKPSQLTNRQLKTVNERLNLETNYRRLNPTTTQRGAKRAKEIMALVGVTTLIGALNTPVGRAALSRGKDFAMKAISSPATRLAARNAARRGRIALMRNPQLTLFP